MIDRDRFDQRAAALEEALQSKLGLRGRSLAARLGRAGRQLPGRIRRQGRVLTEAQQKLVHPKLARQIDDVRITGAFRDFDDYLGRIDPAERRKTAILRWLGGLVFNLIVIGAVLLALLRWQGLI